MSSRDRPGTPPRRGSALWIGALALAAAATAVLVLSEDSRVLKLGLVAALWAALLGALAVAKLRAALTNADRRSAERQRIYELELEREIAARREHEAEAEANARRAAAADADGEIQALKAELRALRENLEKVLGGDVLFERVALRAESTRVRSMAEQGGSGQSRIIQSGGERQLSSLQGQVEPEPHQGRQAPRQAPDARKPRNAQQGAWPAPAGVQHSRPPNQPSARRPQPAAPSERAESRTGQIPPVHDEAAGTDTRAVPGDFAPNGPAAASAAAQNSAAGSWPASRSTARPGPAGSGPVPVGSVAQRPVGRSSGTWSSAPVQHPAAQQPAAQDPVGQDPATRNPGAQNSPAWNAAVQGAVSAPQHPGKQAAAQHAANHAPAQNAAPAAAAPAEAQDQQSDAAGAHTEGTSVVDLLAAYGDSAGDTKPRRRRRG